MEYIELLLQNIKKRQMIKFLDLIYYDLKNIRESHYYNRLETGNDKISNETIKKLISNNSNINIMFQNLIICNIKLKNVLMLITMENEAGDILFSFASDDFFDIDDKYIIKLLENFRNLSIIDGIENVLLGYEPVEDIDMQIIKFIDGSIIKCNPINMKSDIEKKLSVCINKLVN